MPWLCACLGALALSGCSSTASRSGSAVTVTGSTLEVYAAQPPGAADAVSTDVLDAEKLALLKLARGGKVGPFTVQLQVVHGREVSASARAAVQDKTAIAYLGEIAPGTSGVSLQITNQVGLLQLSPTDTAVYLTQTAPAVPDSPGHYYPASSTFHRTFARVVPTTAPEAKALVAEMQALHVSKLYVSPGDGTGYGTSVADEVRQDAHAARLTLVSAPTGADGIFYGGVDGPSAVQALDRLAAANPTSKLFAPSALYDDTLVAKLSPAAQKNLYVSAPGLPAAGQDALAKKFTSDFQSAYHHAPQPQAVYGYETMAALLFVLQHRGANANSRAQVVAAFRGLKDRQSALGTYSLKNGDTSLASSSFVIAHPAGGRLVPRSSP